MRKIRNAMVGAASVLLLAAPLAAKDKAPPTAEELAAMPFDDLTERVDKLGKGSMFDSACAVAPYYGELARRRPVGPVPGFAAFLKGVCASMEERAADALIAYEQAEGLFPSDMDPGIRRLADQLAMPVAVSAKNWDGFAEHARHIARRGDADEFKSLDFDLWRWAMGRAGDDKAGPVALIFVRAEAGPAMTDKVRGLMESYAVKPALAEGETGLAASLASRDPEPWSLLSMLIDRDYAAIWPQLEAAAGPRMGKVLGDKLTKAQREHASAPEDPEKLAALVDAHLMNGQPAAAADAAARQDHSPKAFARLTEQQGWVINAEVKALDRLGRRAEADALFDRLAKVDAEKNGWMVNFTINRADRLVGQGRWAEALPAADLAVSVAERFGSDYAKEVAAADRYCAGIKLNPASPDLVALWARIEAGWASNIGSAIQAAQCKGDTATAKRFIRDGFTHPDARDQLLSALQPRQAELLRDEGNMFEEPRKLLEGDAELTALYAKHGRDLPPAFYPPDPVK